MADLTKSGVCYRLSKSPFYEDYKGYRFFFSSETHRRNFHAKARIKEQWLSDSLSRRFHFDVDASEIAIFQLYWQIETRGFYVVSETGREYYSLRDVGMRTRMVEETKAKDALI